MKPFLLLPLLSIAVIGAARTVSAQVLTAEQWREDLRYLATEVEREHKDLFHAMTREEFESGMARLHERLPSLESHEIIVEMARVTNAVGDGHSGIRIWSDPRIEFRAYPLKLHLLADGLFVQAAERAYANTVGGRLVRIGEVTAEEAIDAISPLIPRDNDQDIKTFAPSLLVMPEILDALGIIEDMERASYVVVREGEEITIELEPGGVFHLEGHSQLDLRSREADWSDARDGPEAPTPLWLKDPENEFWFEYLDDSNTAYIQINHFSNKESETLEAFSDRVFDFIESGGVERVVFDVRWSRGGNNYLTRPVIRNVIRAHEIDQRGNLFVIIGHRTFSAAQSFINRLENWTNAVYVGEPTAQNVNMFGDNRKIVLPNSGITVRASYLWWQDMDPRDTRQWTVPEVAVELTSEDYRNNRDPTMNAIREYVARPSLADRLEEAFGAGGFEAAVAAYHEFKDDAANAYVDTEDVMNEAGYALLDMRLPAEAIVIFELNVEAYPGSSNAYDSLAEAYMEHGDTELAIENYEKSVELNPANTNAVTKLKELRQ
jgi:hypothetical protein